MTVALTGATGFVGGHVLRRLREENAEVRALARRPQQPRDGVAWVAGDLADPHALAELVAGCDRLIHVAGVLNAPDEAGFEAGNVTGTAQLVDAAARAGVGRLVHVSSLAAREPSLSRYGASKARSEEVVRRSALSFAIVRPPAVYGPGDRETLELFRMARRGFVLLPPAGRLSLIHVDDLARLLIGLAEPDQPSGVLIEPDDGSGGFTHSEFAGLLGDAVGRKVLPLFSPKPLLRLAAAVDRLVRGSKAKLTSDRVAYFCHPDWVVSPERAPPGALWRPEISAQAGLAATARWYEAHRWL